MYISSLSIGFIEVYNKITINIYPIGCLRDCKGCSNEVFKDFNYPDKKVLTEEELIHQLKKSDGLVNGICWLGGDALYQPGELINLSQAVYRYNPSLINCLYTGELFENIKDSILTCGINMVVDGKWEGKTIEQKDTNQRIFLKKREWKEVSYEEFKKYGE